MARGACKVEAKKSRHTVLLHDGQELDDDLGGRPDENLALALLLGVVDGVERIVEHASLDHFCGCRRRFSDGAMQLRYLYSENKSQPSEAKSAKSAPR